jgi:hypothetical protein
MTLEEYINTLTGNKKVELALIITKVALPIWDSYAKNNLLQYKDSVVGMMHKVPKDILAATINEIEIFQSKSKMRRIFYDKNKLLHCIPILLIRLLPYKIQIGKYQKLFN